MIDAQRVLTIGVRLFLVKYLSDRILGLLVSICIHLYGLPNRRDLRVGEI